MRFFALQTDINALKKQFLLESEEEILTTRHHSLAFWLPCIFSTIVVAPLTYYLFENVAYFSSQGMGILVGWLIGIVLFFYLCIIEKGFIDWRYNVLILTNQQIIVIEHRFLFHQNLNPIPLTNLASTMSESQLLGIWHCGIVRISLQERKGGSTKEITLRYIPRAEIVAGAINNAMGLVGEKVKEETTQDQLPKVQEVQQKVEKKLPEAGPENAETVTETKTINVPDRNKPK